MRREDAKAAGCAEGGTEKGAEKGAESSASLGGGNTDGGSADATLLPNES